MVQNNGTPFKIVQGVDIPKLDEAEDSLYALLNHSHAAEPEYMRFRSKPYRQAEKVLRKLNMDGDLLHTVATHFAWAATVERYRRDLARMGKLEFKKNIPDQLELFPEQTSTHFD